MATFLKQAVRLAGGSLVAVTGVTSAATAYVYQTDESWRRLTDFHIWTTPILWDYYKHYNNSISHSHDNAQGDNKALEQLHEKYAPQALQVVLDLGGYYVKCAQMFCGMNLLPKEYEKHFSILLDQVPSKHSFSEIQRIVERELGGPLKEHFVEFDETPLAAASIGQVHCAKIRLEQGKTMDVVVKVQYPEVEKYFALDVLSMQNLCHLCQAVGMEIGIDQQSLDKVFREFTSSFEEEFDYRREAQNMKLVADNLNKSPFHKQVKVPQPILSKTTRKVLTMEKLRGEPIQKRMNRVMEEYAERQGKTLHDLEEELAAKFQDPQEVEKIMSQKPPSALELWIYKILLRTTDFATNAQIWVANTFFAKVNQSPQPYHHSTLPLDASSICNLLFQVHAHQLFVDGAFNADPHAGNVMILENDDNPETILGLIDFGNVQRIPDAKRRRDLAQFYRAMANDWSERPETWNDQEIAHRFQAVGGESIHNHSDFLAFNALTAYDMRLDASTLRRFGVQEDMSNVMDVYQNDTFKEFPADLVNLQRLCQTLVGVAGIIGAGQPSCARMWKHQCKELVEDQEDGT